MPRSRPLVYLVDDNPDILETYSELLEDAGFRVETFATGLAALARLRKRPPAAIVIDLNLPDISGFDLYRSQRELPMLDAVATVFISGVYLDEETVRIRLGDPNARLLLKPVPGDVLVREIETARRRFGQAA